jgi:hypothetical protein
MATNVVSGKIIIDFYAGVTKIAAVKIKYMTTK